MTARGNRYKIYNAEQRAGLNSGPGATPEGMQAWLDWVATTKFWKENSSVRHFRVKYPAHPGGMSGATKFMGEGERRIAEIAFGPFSMSLGRACHEATHLTKGLYREGNDDEQDHGSAFATMYLRVVKRYMDMESALDLEAAFNYFKVVYDKNWNG